MAENTSLFTPRSPIFGGRCSLFKRLDTLFKLGYTARPLMTQSEFKLTTQDGRTLTAQGHTSP
jgi:hypothetical protein